MIEAFYVHEQHCDTGWREFEYALVGPDGEVWNRSYSEHNLRLKAEELNKVWNMATERCYQASVAKVKGESGGRRKAQPARSE